jgi:hypothetical protein
VGKARPRVVGAKGKAAPRTVVLDAGALIAFERGDARMRALLRAALNSEARMVIPAGVLTQVWRDPLKQVVLGGLWRAITTGLPLRRRKGHDACARAGIPPVTPKDLRRTYATWWRHHTASRPTTSPRCWAKGDSRMVERVCGRTDAQSLGRTLQRHLGLSEAPSPTRQVSVQRQPEPQNACSAFVASSSDPERDQTLLRIPEVAFLPKILVSEDGIEPPTRGFSILCSTD